MMARPSVSNAVTTEPDPEHERAKEPLPTRSPRPQHPYVTFEGPRPTRCRLSNGPGSPMPTRSPRPLGPDTATVIQDSVIDDARCACGLTFETCRGCPPPSAYSLAS